MKLLVAEEFLIIFQYATISSNITIMTTYHAAPVLLNLLDFQHLF